MGGLIAYRRCRFQPGRFGSGRSAGKLLLVLVLLSGGALVTGCSTLGFYQQAVTGQLKLLTARKDLDKILAELAKSGDEPELQAALLDSRRVVEFARERLGLVTDGRYDSYVDLQRDYVVWNLVVAPVDSTTPRTWCFPVAGCVSYRGYFSEQRARSNAAGFDVAQYDTYVGGVAAYSTLGWFDDPLLSSFIHWPRAARAELLIHELAHGELYVGGDTEFNESFATFVAQTALPVYLAAQTGDTVPGAAQAAELAAHQQRRQETARFNALLLQLREALSADFARLDSKLDAQKRRVQALQLRSMRYQQAGACYNAVAAEFSDNRRAAFFEKPPNMARLSLVGAYHRWVRAFALLYKRQGEQFAAFYSAAAELAALAPEARLLELERLDSLARHALNSTESEQGVQPERDDEYPKDIQCEALADHRADGHIAG